MKTKALVRSALIGCLYYSFVLLNPIPTLSFGNNPLGFQIRISEFLTVLPFFYPEAIFGLTIGCLLANLSSPFGWIDSVFGTACTLIAALLTYSLRRFKNRTVAYAGIIPPVIINAFGVGLYISILMNNNQFTWIKYGSICVLIFIGQAISVGIGGSILISYLLRKEKGTA